MHLTGLCAEEVHLCGESAAIDLVTELMYTTGEEVEVDHMLCSQGGIANSLEYPSSGFRGPRKRQSQNLTKKKVSFPHSWLGHTCLVEPHDPEFRRNDPKPSKSTKRLVIFS